jgi:glycosyltransferase involved in cell wall biosynthesis
MRGRRFRVAHVITRLELGGAQQNTLYCARHHDRERFDVELIAGRGGRLDAEALAIDDARVHLVPYLVHPVAPRRDLQAVLRLRAHFRRRRIDLVHTHSSKAGIVGRIAAHLAGVPAVVHTVHGWSFNDTQPPARRRAYVALERLAGALSDRLLVVAERHRDVGLAAGIARPDRYAVLRSGIDAAGFRVPLRSPAVVRGELGFAREHKVVGTVACLKPQKAPLDFVETAARASAADPRLRFFIAGDGELRGAVLERIAALGLDGKVRLLGWREDVVDLLHAADLFLLTSLFEGLPRAVLQAMAAGTPVVATAVDGTPEVVQHERTGLLVAPGDPASASAAVLRMLGDAGLARACVGAARQRLDASFDVRQMLGDLERTYLELLRDPQRRGAFPERAVSRAG